jgi:hypothetical protein
MTAHALILQLGAGEVDRCDVAVRSADRKLQRSRRVGIDDIGAASRGDAKGRIGDLSPEGQGQEEHSFRQHREPVWQVTSELISVLWVYICLYITDAILQDGLLN